MELFYGRISGNSMRAILILEEIGAKYEPVLVNTKAGDQRSPKYLAINPMGKIPALVDGTLTLWESNAIGWYAAEKHSSAGLIPSTSEQRGAMLKWLFFQTAHVSPACAAIFRHEHPLVREQWNVPPSPQETSRGQKELERYFPVLESALASASYLAGALSLADLAYVPHLHLVEETGFDFTPYPAIVRWLHALRARDAWRRTVELSFAV
jgi:glutathione S-transferase